VGWAVLGRFAEKIRFWEPPEAQPAVSAMAMIRLLAPLAALDRTFADDAFPEIELIATIRGAECFVIVAGRDR
jgi:hypothetical protein